MEYIDYLTLEDLRILAEKRADYCISLYLPTQRKSKEIRQNPIRLKNLLGRAEQELVRLGLRQVDAARFIEPARALISEVPFWQRQSDGLALFISRAGMRQFRLPIPFEEMVVIGDRFHLKPVLALFNRDGRYYVLALSQNETRLFQCTRHSAFEIQVDGMPKNLADALKYDSVEQQIQFHTRTAGIKAVGAGARGRRPAMFHGQGGGTDDEKDWLIQYFLQVDKSLQKVLSHDQAPLVLASVDYLLPIYRGVNSYNYLMDKGIEGNPELLKPEELQKNAWTVVEPYFSRTQQEAVEKFNREFGTGHASNDIKAIVRAAANGRVDSLFVTTGKQVWGFYNPRSEEVHVHEKEEAGDDDLLDVAAIQTVLNGGTVFAVKEDEIPGGSSIAANFRY